MILASNGYPLADAMWTMLVFFAWIIWFWLLITIFADLFRRPDIGGWGKAGWTVVLLFLPFIGVLVYLISQSRAMADRRMTEAQDAQRSFDTYVKSVAATDSRPAEQIGEAKKLLEEGAITADEFETLKRKALAG